MPDGAESVDIELFHEVHDFGTGVEAFRADVLEGLGRSAKVIPPKHFYDERGSELFDAICRTADYYPTRTEKQILAENLPDIAASIGPQVALVEPGAGALEKVRLLIDALDRPRAYVPVDISGEFLMRAAEAFAQDHPHVPVIPVTADFTHRFPLPDLVREGPVAGFFPGSTIGNFEPAEAQELLTELHVTLGPGSGLLIGVDTVKDSSVLLRAYDDSEGVTAAFNLNLLSRINRELDGDFDLTQFRHRVRWNAERSRIEMHLESLIAQQARIAGRDFAFAAGETIHTESSHKYAPEAFTALAASAGWVREAFWTTGQQMFGVYFLRAAA